MMYIVPEHINKNKIFVVNRSELEGRIDPHQFHIERVTAISKIKLNNEIVKLKKAVKNVKSTTTKVESTDIYIGLENIESDTGKYIETNEKNSISSAGIFKKGNVLFPKLRPYLNKVHLADFDGICSTEFHIFEGIESFLNEFLVIYLRSNLIVNQTKHLMTGNTLPRLQTEDINNLPVPKISIEKQKEIIRIYNDKINLKQQKEAEAKVLLDSIDNYLLDELGITLPEQSNALENRIFTTNFSEITGGRIDPDFYSLNIKNIISAIQNAKFGVQKLKKYCQFVSGYAFSSDDYVNESDCKLITIKNINKNYINLNDTTYLPNDYYDKYKRFRILKDDLVFAMTGATIGKVGIYFHDDKSLLNQRNGIIRSELINTFYLMNILNMDIYQTLIYRNAVGGAQPNISETNIMNLAVPLPSIEKQNEIAEKISAIRNKAKKLQEEAKQIVQEAQNQVEQMIIG